MRTHSFAASLFYFRIGWAHARELKLEVDDYEMLRLPRRPQHELILTRQVREEFLLEWGFNFNEIIDAIRTNNHVKNQRCRTVHAIGTYDRWEEVTEKVKRTLLLPKSLPKQQQHVVTHPCRSLDHKIFTVHPDQRPRRSRPPALPRQPDSIENPVREQQQPSPPTTSLQNARHPPTPQKSPVSPRNETHTPIDKV
jgi:hypothetical protein